MEFDWRTETDEPAPTSVTEVDDRLTAAEAVKRTSRHEYLLYTGDFHNAKQLLSAMARRLSTRASDAPNVTAAFHRERQLRRREHDTVGRVLVALDANSKLSLRRAPDLSEACRWAFGPLTRTTLVPLKAVLGAVGAAEWRRRGLEVPGLNGRLTPHYGVYTPTRADYVELLRHVDDVSGRTVFDIGAGTGVLSFVLLQRGAARAVATDIDGRAVTCALENAAQLKLTSRFEAVEANLFPPGTADLIISNPPWVPERPRNRLDRAVFDDGTFVTRFLGQARDHLTPNGRVALLMSDLAVLLGLRPSGWLVEAFAAAGLTLTSRFSTFAVHPRALDADDALHAARSKEQITLFLLSATDKSPA